MSRYKAYPEYKDSGVAWLGAIPSHWEISPLKYLARFSGGGTPSKDNPDFWNGDIPWVSPKDMKVRRVAATIDNVTESAIKQSSSNLLDKGALLMVVRSGILQHSIPVAINDVPVSLNQDMKALRFADPMLSEYAYYFVIGNQSSLLLEWSKEGATVESIEHEYLASTLFPCPPLKDRTTIINFLDHETAKIDALMEKQRRLIELLKEKRQAVISHAVTKGLNPNAPMKDSCVEWLAEVPAHWVVKRMKYSIRVFEQGWSPQCDSRPAAGEEFGVLKVGCVNGGFFNSEENKALPSDLTPQIQYVLKKGDFLISRANTRDLVGSAAIVEDDFDKLILCDKLYRLRFSENINAYLVSFYLSIPSVRQQIELGTSGASDSMQNISQSVIKELQILIPPVVEAELLVKEIKNRLTKFDEILSAASQQIVFLQERRTALISAAVTGKIDVRDWQAAA